MASEAASSCLQPPFAAGSPRLASAPQAAAPSYRPRPLPGPLAAAPPTQPAPLTGESSAAPAALTFPSSAPPGPLGGVVLMSPHCSSDLGLPEMCLSPDLASSPCGSLSSGHLWPQGHNRSRCSAHGVGVSQWAVQGEEKQLGAAGVPRSRGRVGRREECPPSPMEPHRGSSCEKQLGPRGPRARKAFPDVTPQPRLQQGGPRGEGAASSLAHPLSAGRPLPSGSWPRGGSLFPAHWPFSNRHVWLLGQPAFGCSDQCTEPLKGCPFHVEAVDTGSHLCCSPSLSLMVRVGAFKAGRGRKGGDATSTSPFYQEGRRRAPDVSLSHGCPGARSPLRAHGPGRMPWTRAHWCPHRGATEGP